MASDEETRQTRELLAYLRTVNGHRIAWFSEGGDNRSYESAVQKIDKYMADDR